MSQSPSSQPRRFRWQLSLRMLLVFMALIGIGLAVFRWPWVETTSHDVMMTIVAPPVDPFAPAPAIPAVPKVLYHEENRTTYRRNWRAKAVKNGVEKVFRDGKLLHESHYYEGGLHGIRRAYASNGNVNYEVTFQHGVMHGPAWHRPEPDILKWRGEFIQNEPHGPWEMTVYQGWQTDVVEPRAWVSVDFPESTWQPSPHLTLSPVRIRSDWDHGKRNGEWTWETLDEGVTLRTASYQQGEVVKIDDVPILAQFQERLQRQASEPGVSETVRFLDTATKQNWRCGYLCRFFGTFHGYCIEIERSNAAAERLFIHGLKLSPDNRLRGDNLLPSLCEFAAQSNHRLEFRYGGLLFVPGIGVQPFLDPTGIENVKFAPGSSQERDWTEVIDVVSSSRYGKGCLQELLKNTSINFTIDQATDSQSFDPELDGQLLFRRRRCDVIGLVCYLSGLLGEQRGNALTFTRNPERTPDQGMSHPLVPPVFLEPRPVD